MISYFRLFVGTYNNIDLEPVLDGDRTSILGEGFTSQPKSNKG